jgi:arginine utilization protein RocB
MIDKSNILKNLKRLVSVSSISGTEEENRMAQEVQKLLYEIPYFNEHRDAVKLVPLNKDPLSRSIVTAFWECHPKCDKTVILTGHYDVVDVEEYGHLKDKAYDIEAITKCIYEMPLDPDSKKDFESGEWLFGRGTADMKYGHALCLELLKHFSKEGGINGNLLYVAVCGEETNSEGMLRAVSFFNELAAEKEITYSALLLTECYMMEDQANDNNRYIHFGASGKIMPMYLRLCSVRTAIL